MDSVWASLLFATALQNGLNMRFEWFGYSIQGASIQLELLLATMTEPKPHLTSVKSATGFVQLQTAPCCKKSPGRADRRKLCPAVLFHALHASTHTPKASAAALPAPLFHSASSLNPSPTYHRPLPSSLQEGWLGGTHTSFSYKTRAFQKYSYRTNAGLCTR